MDQTTHTAGRPAPALTDRDRLEFRNRLIGMRDRVTGEITALRSAGATTRDSANTEEDGTDEYNREMAMEMASAKRGTLVEIDDALARLQHGTYGLCETCQHPIEKPRINALPFVRTCIGCQSQIERRR